MLFFPICRISLKLNIIFNLWKKNYWTTYRYFFSLSKGAEWEKAASKQNGGLPVQFQPWVLFLQPVMIPTSVYLMTFFCCFMSWRSYITRKFWICLTQCGMGSRNLTSGSMRMPTGASTPWVWPHALCPPRPRYDIQVGTFAAQWRHS